MRQIRTAAIATLGCKLNQSESDQMARQLSQAGVEIVPFGEAADLYIVNSCTVTHVGDRKSRQLIRQAVRANPGAFVAVAGCYAELEPGAVAAIEGVGAIIGNAGKERLVEALGDHGLLMGVQGCDGVGGSDALLSAAKHLCGIPSPHGRRTEVLRYAQEGTTRVRMPDSIRHGEPSAPSTQHPAPKRTRAFVKIQEGCDNRCSYCIVPTARGEGRSLPEDAIMEEVRRLTADGYQEIVLTGVNITTYGRDRVSGPTAAASRGMGLMHLLHTILHETDIPRVRLSSLQPEDWQPAFYELWASGRLCRHLHLSLQSGSDGVLRRMRRRYNTTQYARIVEEARRALPGVAITTDVIAGFPGETDAEHAETEAFLRVTNLADLHAFKYSPRAGTDAAAMPGQVSPRVKQERSKRLIALAGEMNAAFRGQLAGAVLGVLWEESPPAAQARKLGVSAPDGRILWSGLSDNYVRVYAPGPDELQGTIGGARIGPLAGDGVMGTLVRGG